MAETTRLGGRIAAIDLARAIALIGMMATHLGPSWWGDGPAPVSEIVAGGRAAPLFALLAGVSLALVYERDPRGVGSVRATCIRAALLLAIGLALASLSGLRILVILPVYALLIVLALPFRSWSSSRLLLLGGLWAVLSPVLLLVVRRAVDEPVLHAPQLSFADIGELVHLPVELLVWGPYPAVVWFAYVIVGLGIGRLDLRDAATGLWLAVVGATLAAGTLLLGLAGVQAGLFEDRFGEPAFSQAFASGVMFDPLAWTTLLAAGQHTSTPLNVTGAIGSALLVIGLCLLLERSARAIAFVAPLLAAGSMTLTLYVCHVVLAWMGDVHGLTLVGGEYAEWLAQIVLLGVVAWAWRSFFRRGPLESVVHTVSLLGRRA